MTIFLVYSTSGITSGKKVSREVKMAAILKFLKYQTQIQFDLRYEKIVPNYAQKFFFMMMTSSMTSQGGLKVGPLYSFINGITTFFFITKKRAKISSLNFLCKDITRLWLCLYKHICMTSLMTSPGHRVGQIFRLIYLRQYLSYSVDQRLKMSEMLMAIFLVYSTSGITSCKKVCREDKMAAILNFLKYQNQLQFDLIYEKIVPNYVKKSFLHDDYVIDDVTGWPRSFHQYSCLGEVGSANKLLGPCLVNQCKYHNCLSKLNMPKDDLDE